MSWVGKLNYIGRLVGGGRDGGVWGDWVWRDGRNSHYGMGE